MSSTRSPTRTLSAAAGVHIAVRPKGPMSMTMRSGRTEVTVPRRKSITGPPPPSLR